MIWNALDHYRDLGLLIARLGFGLGFTWFHGIPKLMSGMDGLADRGREMALFGITFGYEWWGLLAALIETLAGLTIAFGIFFRLSSLALLSVMFVATVANFAGRSDPAHPLQERLAVCRPDIHRSRPVTAWTNFSHAGASAGVDGRSRYPNPD